MHSRFTLLGVSPLFFHLLKLQYISTNAYLRYTVPFRTICYVRLVSRSIFFPLMILID